MSDTLLGPRDDDGLASARRLPPPPMPSTAGASDLTAPPAGEPPVAGRGSLPPDAPRSDARRSGGWRPVVAAAVVSAVVAAGVAVPVTRALVPEEPATTAPASTVQVEGGTASPVAAVARAVLPTVARIDVVGAGGQGSGSAVIFRSDGYLLTNNHVVEGAAQVRVTLPDGSVETAEIVGSDPSSDLAVIRVDAEDLPTPAFADELPEPGDLAVAIGSPFGLDGTVTSGVVSALNRDVPAPGVPLVGMIQTDAAINPGNSGGALANAEGEIVGINTAILSGSGANAGVGFAIPITTALDAAEQLVEHGFVQRPQLGVQGQDVDPQVAEIYNLPVERGAVLVEVVPGSPADGAGLQRGDIVTAIDGEEVTSMADLAANIRRFRPGDEVTLTVHRGAEELRIDVELEAAPEER